MIWYSLEINIFDNYSGNPPLSHCFSSSFLMILVREFTTLYLTALSSIQVDQSFKHKLINDQNIFVISSETCNLNSMKLSGIFLIFSSPWHCVPTSPLNSPWTKENTWFVRPSFFLLFLGSFTTGLFLAGTKGNDL